MFAQMFCLISIQSNVNIVCVFVYSRLCRIRTCSYGFYRVASFHCQRVSLTQTRSVIWWLLNAIMTIVEPIYKSAFTCIWLWGRFVHTRISGRDVRNRLSQHAAQLNEIIMVSTSFIPFPWFLQSIGHVTWVRIRRLIRRRQRESTAAPTELHYFWGAGDCDDSITC